MEISFLMLSYFKKTAERQHLSAAAEELRISQPALSKMLSSLESKLGVQLFDRVGRNIVLNNNGQVFLKYAEIALKSMDDAQKELQLLQNTERQTVTLAPYVASSLVPGILTDFSKKNPYIHYHLLQQNSEKLMPPNAGDADLYLYSSVYPIESDNSVTLLCEDLVLAMPEKIAHMYPDSINLAELDGSDFICLQSGKDLRTITDFYFQMAGVTPNIILESDSPQTVRDFIRAGIGMALIPSISWSDIRGENVTLRRISNPHCQRYIHLSWTVKRPLSEAAALLKDYLIDNFSSFASAKALKHDRLFYDNNNTDT